MVVIYCEADTESYEHVGNLRDRRESQTTLDITLAASYGCCIECGEGCNVSYIVQCLRSILYPDWEEAGYLITPATTMVAAWINAETGVGPSIASGNQMCNGNIALLPAPPMNMRNNAVGITQAAPAKAELSSG